LLILLCLAPNSDYYESQKYKQSKGPYEVSSKVLQRLVASFNCVNDIFLLMPIEYDHLVELLLPTSRPVHVIETKRMERTGGRNEKNKEMEREKRKG
jgi:hypothetical protein